MQTSYSLDPTKIPLNVREGGNKYNIVMSRYHFTNKTASHFYLPKSNLPCIRRGTPVPLDWDMQI